MWTVALFSIAKIRKQPKCKWTDECLKINTHTHTHTHKDYYSAIKNNEIMQLAAIEIELEIIVSNEIERQISYDITYI